MLFTKTLTLFLFNIFLIISNILAQQPSVQITGQITGTNGPNRGINNIPLEFSGDAFTSTVHDTTAGQGNYSVEMLIDAIQDNTFVPLKYDMGNYPNPFNPHTTVYFNLPSAEDVVLEIFDIRGRKVKTLMNDRMRAGHHEIQWDATNDQDMSVAEGVYLYRLLTKSGHMQSGKMIYMHGGSTQQSSFSSNIQSGNHGTNIQTDGFTEGDSLDVIMDLAETDSTEADQITFKVGDDGGTYEKNGTVPWKNFPPTVINQQGNITTPEDNAATTSPIDSLFYDFNLADPGDLQFTVNNLPPGSNVVYNNGRLDIFTPENYNGTVSDVTITASDGQYQVDTDPFDITYNPVNDAPVIGQIDDITLDRGDSTYVTLNASDVDNLLSELLFSASGYNPQDLTVTIDNIAKQALIKAIGSGNHNILWRVTDPPGLYDEATQNVNINYIAMLNALLMAAVTDDILPGITVKVDGTPYVSNAQGIVTLPFRTGQRQLVEVDSNATTHGWQRGITYNREEDGDLDDILLLGSEADFQLYKDTDRADLPGDPGGPGRFNNWIYQHPNLTYILVNPPSPEFEEAAKQRLMSDFDTLDYKGRQTFTWTQTINDTITPEDSLEKVYSQGNYADVAVIWKDTGGPSGLNSVKLDSSGRALWGTVFLRKQTSSPEGYGYFYLKGEMFGAGAPSTADADSIQYPQYQLSFFGTDPPGFNDLFDEWGNPRNPDATVNYFGEDIAIEILKMTMKLDYFYKYGNGVKWDTPRIIIPDITIN